MTSPRRPAVPRFAVPSLLHALVIAVACAGLALPQAGAAPVDKKAFLERPAMYLQFELTHTGQREFGAGTPPDALVDAAWRFTKTVKFEVPLAMAMPGTPLVSAPPSMNEMMEQERFIGWMASPPEDGAGEATPPTAGMDLTKNAMFLPATYSVDDVHQTRRRDTPADRFGTETTTARGSGKVYAPLSGMMMCDLKKLVCDIVNVPGGYNGGTDKLTVITTSDVPGFEKRTESPDPSLWLPGISPELGKQLQGMSISLQDPITKTFTAPAPGPTGGPHLDGSTVTLKVTVSSKPAVPAAVSKAR